MGSGPSTPPPPPAHGSRSSNVHRISRGAGGGERVDGEVSVPEHTPLGYGDYQEIMLRVANNPELPTPYDPRGGGGMPEPMCDMSASHRADSVLHDYAFDDEDPARLGEVP